ncbi:MAG: ribbon-helix-helix protein, CopG family [Spirochaetales bacterium]|nr:MAG: ribbon-helix-helix protein, CopG family [Spirochaetales bacterium]
MGSTTIHFPENILSRIDRAAARRKMSRNRFVLEACEAALAEDAGEWPEGFFEPAFSVDEKFMLREAVIELEETVFLSRRNRGVPLL